MKNPSIIEGFGFCCGQPFHWFTYAHEVSACRYNWLYPIWERVLCNDQWCLYIHLAMLHTQFTSRSDALHGKKDITACPIWEASRRGILQHSCSLSIDNQSPDKMWGTTQPRPEWSLTTSNHFFDLYRAWCKWEIMQLRRAMTLSDY